MLKIWRQKESDQLFLDMTPRGLEEEENLYSTPVSDPRDLNAMMVAERRQNMDERIFYADRAFIVTLVWVIFLVVLTIIQMVLSFWKAGLTDAQFVTVVTTTTASVLGFWLLVGRYLHHRD